MAGIGFELKKLFNKKGVFNTAKAYGYAAVICAGPMLLGVILLLGIMALCSLFGVGTHTRELLICMITYTLLASVTVSSFFSMVVTRYVADMLFEEKNHAVLPVIKIRNRHGNRFQLRSEQRFHRGKKTVAVTMKYVSVHFHPPRKN